MSFRFIGIVGRQPWFRSVPGSLPLWFGFAVAVTVILVEVAGAILYLSRS